MNVQELLDGGGNIVIVVQDGGTVVFYGTTTILNGASPDEDEVIFEWYQTTALSGGMVLAPNGSELQLDVLFSAIGAAGEEEIVAVTAKLIGADGTEGEESTFTVDEDGAFAGEVVFGETIFGVSGAVDEEGDSVTFWINGTESHSFAFVREDEAASA